MMQNDIDHVKFDAAGLVPAIVQDADTGAVLMLAYMNRESLEKTLGTGETFFWSRSRNELWHKGETSGNTQQVVSITVDCDADTLLVQVHQTGNACHTGTYTCFDNASGRTKTFGEEVGSLAKIIARRKEELPEESYTTYLFTSGIDKILKKVGEESAETIIAAKNNDTEEIVRESADLLYHLLVMFSERGVSLPSVGHELQLRAGKKPKKTAAHKER